MYKLYCSVLNSRLTSWSDENHKLEDEQNDFRKGKSTTDHISSLMNIIDTRKKLKKSTFCAFRAMRVFLGVGKYTHNDAVSGEMAWNPTSVRQWKSVCLYRSKLAAMGYIRLNKRIALWASEKSSRSCKNWMYSISQFLIANNFGHYANIAEAIPSSHRFIADIENILFENFVTTWLARINSNVGPSGRGRNKLRLYKTFKQNYSVENYCKMMLPVRHRAAFSKFRCGVAPIRIETGRSRDMKV